jgi:DNA-binding NtrC family response regulator
VSFLRTYAGRMGKDVTGISSPALELLLNHSWPGNVRELEKAIERAVVLAPSPVIRPEDLPPALHGAAEAAPATPRARTLADVEKAHILSTLYEHGWNQARAAEELGISRTTLWRKLRDYGVAPDV